MSSATLSAERAWTPDWPCPVDQMLAPFRHGSGDPTYHRDAAGRHWRAVHTPEGPTTVVIEARSVEGTVLAHAFGPGATWALDALPGLLGAEDDPSGFEPAHPVLQRTWRKHRHLRIGASGLVLESLVPAIIEQKVTGQEAFDGFRDLVRRFGDPAPGPGEKLGLMVQPSPETLRSIPSWEWLKLHIDPARSKPLVRVATLAASLERAAGEPPEEFEARLTSIPGIGRWTSAEVRARVLGDADALSVGDYHLARNVGWTLQGEVIDDDALEELLEPYRPHRHRVQQLVGLAGADPPRRGPRMPPRHHLPR